MTGIKDSPGWDEPIGSNRSGGRGWGDGGRAGVEGGDGHSGCAFILSPAQHSRPGPCRDLQNSQSFTRAASVIVTVTDGGRYLLNGIFGVCAFIRFDTRRGEAGSHGQAEVCQTRSPRTQRGF